MEQQNYKGHKCMINTATDNVKVAKVGLKFDDEKNRLDLIPPAAIIELGKVLTMGSAKYGDRNWEKGIAYHRVYGAALRHLIAFWQGENLDSESGLLHLSHCLCNIAFLIGFESNREKYGGFDDRPFMKGS